MPDRPEGRGIPGRDGAGLDGAAVEPEPVGRVGDPEPGKGGAGRRARGRGDPAVQPGGGTDK